MRIGVCVIHENRVSHRSDRDDLYSQDKLSTLNFAMKGPGRLLSNLKFSISRNPCNRICDLFKFGISYFVTFAIRKNTRTAIRACWIVKSHLHANICSVSREKEQLEYLEELRSRSEHKWPHEYVKFVNAV